MILTITEINPSLTREKRAGGTYTAFEFKGLKEDGTESTQSVATSFLKTNTNLKADLDGLVVGGVYDIKLKKNGLYWNLEGATPITKAEGTTRQSTTKPLRAHDFKTQSKSTYVDNSIGMQVGNALTNAATLIAAGARKGDLESVAEDVLRVGERLKAKLVAGDYAATNTKSTQATTTTEDIPFGED